MLFTSFSGAPGRMWMWIYVRDLPSVRCPRWTGKRWIWWSAVLQETLIRCHRQSFKNDASDFADSELLLQDFVRRYTDDTLEKPLNMSEHRIGI